MSIGVALAVTYHDPSGVMIERLTRALPRTLAYFDAAVVQCSALAPDHGVALFGDLGMHVRRAGYDETGLNVIGRARRDAVCEAADLDAGTVFYSDIDHIVRWAEHAPDELAEAVSAAGAHDVSVFGRTAAAIRKLPDPLRATETIINRVFTEVTGHEWDLLSGVRALSRAAIEEVVATDGEDTAANDVTWVYRALLEKLDVVYLEVHGLDYEDQQQFGRPERDDDFRRRIESDPANWLARLRIAEQMVAALVHLSSAPPNPEDGGQTDR